MSGAIPLLPYMTLWCGQDKLYLFTLILNTLKKGGSKEINTKGRKKKKQRKKEIKKGKLEGKGVRIEERREMKKETKT
jgi:hypothetical protein